MDELPLPMTVLGPPDAMGPLKVFQGLLKPVPLLGNPAGLYDWPLKEPVKRLCARPGGAARPGGGPLAVVKPLGLAAPIMVDMELGDTWEAVCPERTPRGFLEKLKRMPPLTLLWSGCP